MSSKTLNSSRDNQDDSDSSHGIVAWLVVLSASLFFFYEFVQLNLFNALNMELRVEFNMNATQISFISSTSLIANLLLLIPAGLLLDRLSTRKIILFALSIVILGTFGFAFATSVFALGFFHFIAGFGNAFCFLSCVLLVIRWFPHKLHATVIGIVVTVAFLGGVIAEAPLAWLVSKFDWRTAMLIDGGVGLVILAIIYWQVRDMPNTINKSTIPVRHNTEPFWTSLFKAAKSQQSLFGGAYTSLLNLPIMVLAAIWGAPYLVQVHGLELIQATFISSMIFFGSMIGCPIVGWTSDRLLKRRLPMIMGAIFSLIIMLMIIYLPGQTYTSLLILFFLLGFFTSSQIITYPMISESTPKQISGVAISVASVIIMTGAAIARNIYGLILDYQFDGTIIDGQPIYSAADHQTAILLFPITLALGLIAALLCKETHCRTQY